METLVKRMSCLSTIGSFRIPLSRDAEAALRSCAPAPEAVTQKSISVPRTEKRILRCLVNAPSGPPTNPYRVCFSAPGLSPAGGGRVSRTVRSSRETDPSHQILQTRVRAQRIQPRLYAQVLQLDIVCLDTHPRATRTPAPVRRVRSAESPVPLLTRALCSIAVAGAPPRSRAITGTRGRCAQINLCGMRIQTERRSPACRHQRPPRTCLSRMGVTEEEMGVRVAPVQLDRFVQSVDRLIVATADERTYPTVALTPGESGSSSRAREISLIACSCRPKSRRYVAYQRCASARLGFSSIARLYSRSASAHSHEYVMRFAST